MTSSKKFIALICISLVSLIAVGCSDDSSPVATPAPVDTAPPAVPANLQVDYASHQALVQWAANTTDADLAGYIVSRESGASTVALIDTPTMINSYTDPNPVNGVSYYHVYAVDESGNQSAVASIQLNVEVSRSGRDLDQSW